MPAESALGAVTALVRWASESRNVLSAVVGAQEVESAVSVEVAMK